MIVFDNAVWIHVPKTAGTSFEDMCFNRHGLNVTGIQHDTARDIPTALRERWIFGFMRNPVLAEYSNYRYHRFSWGGNSRFTFEEWCIWRYVSEDKNYGKLFSITQKQIDYGFVFNVRPQAGYFCNEDGISIADKIFRFENLGPSINEVSQKLGIDCSLDGTSGMTYNWSRGREDYSKDISEKSIDILRKAKGIDFMLYEWGQEIPTNFRCSTVPDYAYSR